MKKKNVIKILERLKVKIERLKPPFDFENNEFNNGKTEGLDASLELIDNLIIEIDQLHND